MSSAVDSRSITRLTDELHCCLNVLCHELLAHRCKGAPWRGKLSSSALSTATAVSALALLMRSDRYKTASAVPWLDKELKARYRKLVQDALQWLCDRQNLDGGWGDTEKSLSNISTTALALAACVIARSYAKDTDQVAKAEQRASGYITQHGGYEAILRRYGDDRTFAAPIMMNLALAGLVPWQQVPKLPFELAVFPQAMFRFLGLPVVSYAIPALVAVGQAVHANSPSLNPVARLARNLARRRSLQLVWQMQPASGGFLEAIPLTSFVAMGLLAAGRASHPIVRNCYSFLEQTVRPDGSWPIDVDLACWVTNLAVKALIHAEKREEVLDLVPWILSCQHKRRHPFTGARPGGWAWTDRPGGVPDVDDTSAALISLALLRPQVSLFDRQTQSKILAAATQGIGWLIAVQNRDGGWPTFCRGWGKLPFDRSCVDLTAHAVRALLAWISDPVCTRGKMLGNMMRAIVSGVRFLLNHQHRDGSWTPLWFGNEHHPQQENRIYGTSRAIVGLAEFVRFANNAYRGDTTKRKGQPLFGQLIQRIIVNTPTDRCVDAIERGQTWLANQQNVDGGWGQRRPELPRQSTFEETAFALEAMATGQMSKAKMRAIENATAWIGQAVQAGLHRDAAPIGLYFSLLWYYEELYPLIFGVEAIAKAISFLSEGE